MLDSNMLTVSQQKVLKFLSETLQENDIEFQITGGLAAIMHGAKRPLYDIDIDISKKDVEKTRELLKEYIVVDWNNDLEDGDQFDLWMMTLEIDNVPIDISQIEESKARSQSGDWIPFPEFLEYEEIPFQGYLLPVQKKQPLIDYKKIIARDTDLEDIQQIS